MGFLDHSTNNIIIDAVLTDEGRRQLASVDKSAFTVSKFAFGDDEIDYSIIRKYGRAVGKEKIIKNTPIFEAQTRSNLALKYRMLSLSNPNVIFLPKLVFNTNGNNFIDLGISTNQSLNLQFRLQVGSNGTQILPISESEYSIYVPSRFLTTDAQLVSLEPGTKTAYYRKSSLNDVLSFAISTVPVDDTTFSLYARGNGSTVTMSITIIGNSTGVRYDLPVNISK